MDLSKHIMIGEILILRGLITRSQLNMAKKLQEPARESGSALVDDGIISSEDLDISLGWQLAETIVGLGYAGERDVFGSLRISVVKSDIRSITNNRNDKENDDRNCQDFSDF